MIVDSHVHISSPSLISNWKNIAESEPYFKLLCESPVNRFASAEDVIEYMDKYGIDRSIVFGFAFQKDENLRSANEYVIDSVAKYPDRLIGFGVVNPLSSGMPTEMDRCANGGLIGIGELFPTGQNFDLGNVYALTPFVEKCREHSFILSIHANEPVGHYYAGKTSTTLQQLQEFAESFPDIIIIYAHFGGGLPFYELMPEIRGILKNVYYDTAAAPYLFESRVYPVIKSLGIINKLVFGSDFPLPCAPKTFKIIENLHSEYPNLIFRKEVESVLGENLSGILKNRGQP